VDVETRPAAGDHAAQCCKQSQQAKRTERSTFIFPWLFLKTEFFEALKEF
jgi:hypothetical protein